MTFGQIIAEARKKAGLSQKDLASRIKKEDGFPISPQYLNDLERDRRNPPSQYLLKQFADELKIKDEYLYFVAGQYPDDLRTGSYRPEKVEEAFRLFRKTVREE